MLDLIIIVILLIGLFVGIRRGFVLQIVHLSGFVLAYILAYLYYGQLAPQLRLWIPYPTVVEKNQFFSMLNHMNLQSVYYNAIAFGIIFIGTKIATQIIGSMLDFLADLPFFRVVNRWLGGTLGFIEVYLLVFILLYLGAIMPFFGIEKVVGHSQVAHIIINNTPMFSERIRNLWMSHFTS